MNINKKKLLIIIVVCIVVIGAGYQITIAIIKANISSWPLDIFGHQLGKFDFVMNRVKDFYKELSTDLRKENNINEMFKKYFIKKCEDEYSLTPPVEGYTHPYDFNIHLMLPERLYSENPMIIAYSSYDGNLEEFKKKYKIDRRGADLAQSYRFVTFLFKSNLKVVFIPKETLKIVLGEKQMQKKPDIYSWWFKGMFW